MDTWFHCSCQRGSHTSGSSMPQSWMVWPAAVAVMQSPRQHHHPLRQQNLYLVHPSRPELMVARDIVGRLGGRQCLHTVSIARSSGICGSSSTMSPHSSIRSGFCAATGSVPLHRRRSGDLRAPPATPGRDSFTIHSISTCHQSHIQPSQQQRCRPRCQGLPPHNRAASSHTKG